MTQPRTVFVPVHGTAVFSVTVNASQPYSIVWHHDSPTEPSHIIPDGLGFDVHSLTMSVPDCQNDWSYEGEFWISITNAYGGAISQRARMNVVAAPKITSLPGPQTVNVGGTLNISVSADLDAAPAVSFQWFKYGQPIAGATSQTFSISHVKASDAGDYQCDVTTLGGTTRSDFIHVEVAP